MAGGFILEFALAANSKMNNVQGRTFFIELLRCCEKMNARRAQSTPPLHFSSRLVFAPSIYGLVLLVNFYLLRVLDSPLAGLAI